MVSSTNKSNRSFENAAGILSALLSKKRFQKKIEDCRAFEVWNCIVGEKIAERTEPVSLRKGVLKVKVSNHSWLQQLQFLKEEIRERINGKLGREVLTNIFFQVGEITVTAKKEPNIAEELRKIGLSDEEKKTIEDTVKNVKDEEIKISIKSAMIREAKRKKLNLR